MAAGARSASSARTRSAREAPRRDRLHEVARLLERARARVDEHARARDQRVVALAHLRRERADQVDVRPRPHRRAADERLARRRRAGDDVASREALVDGRHGLGRDGILGEVAGERFGAIGVPPPDQHALDRPHRAVRRRHVRRERAGPDDEQRARVRTRQVGRRERGRGAGPPQGQRLAVDQRDRMPGRAVHQHVHRRDAREPALAVAGEHGDELDAQPLPVPRGHEQQPVAGRGHRVARAHRRGRAGHEGRAQRVDERRRVERRRARARHRP